MTPLADDNARNECKTDKWKTQYENAGYACDDTESNDDASGA
jgi:hypothetical protein